MSIELAAIPLVVGITGHRDLRPEDVPALECRLREIFLELERSYPHTPIVLLSPLAEGADRLGARIALETGCRLIAPLPMAVAEYKNDFGSAASGREFDELLAKTESWFELPVVEGGVPEAVRSPGDARATARRGRGAAGPGLDVLEALGPDDRRRAAAGGEPRAQGTEHRGDRAGTRQEIGRAHV